MTDTDESGQSERALVLGPLAVPGLVLALAGLRRRRGPFVFAGAVLVGLAVKLIDRPQQTADSGVAAAAEPTTDEPELKPGPARDPIVQTPSPPIEVGKWATRLPRRTLPTRTSRSRHEVP
jgi:hypothetical protein